MAFPILPSHTFEDGRKCPYCGSPCPDQYHGSQVYCPKGVNPDGTKHNCKYRFHKRKNKQKNKIYNDISQFQKEQTLKIELLQKHKGNDIILADLNQYEIQLNRAVQIEVDKNKVYTFHYAKHTLSQLPNNKYKISLHGKSF